MIDESVNASLPCPQRVKKFCLLHDKPNSKSRFHPGMTYQERIDTAKSLDSLLLKVYDPKAADAAKKASKDMEAAEKAMEKAGKASEKAAKSASEVIGGTEVN